MGFLDIKREMYVRAVHWDGRNIFNEWCPIKYTLIDTVFNY